MHRGRPLHTLNKSTSAFATPIFTSVFIASRHHVGTRPSPRIPHSSFRGASLHRRHASTYPKRRAAVRMHSSSHAHSHAGSTQNDFSCCSSTPPPSDELSIGPLLVPLRRVLDLQENLRATLISAVLVALAATLRILNAYATVANTALVVAGALTLLPALLATALRLYRARLAAVDVGLLMSVAALVCVCTGAPVEGVLLATLYALSHATEHALSARATRDLRALRDLAPETALRLAAPPAAPVSVPLADIVVGDLVLVRGGELVPCDGVLDTSSSSAFVAVPHLTGESTPRAVAAGDNVPAGARSLDGPLIVRVTRVGEDSSLARIERLVADAQKSRPAVLSFFDKFGQLYSRAVLIIATAIAFCLPALRPSVAYAGHDGSFKRALSFLVVTSPCALVIAAPLAHVATLSACARRGVLVKSGARAIEQAARTKSVIFDKTGTLTTGNLSLVAVTQLSRVPAEIAPVRATLTEPEGVSSAGHVSWTEVSDAKLREVVSVAASLERSAVHPLANAILAKAKALDVPFFNTDDVRTVSGQGIEGIVSCRTSDGDLDLSMSRIGRTKFAASSEVVAYVASAEDEASAAGETVTILQHGDEHYMLRFRDEVRSAARGTVATLANRGHDLFVLTGDGRGAAAHVAREIGGMCEVVPEATPASKLKHVRDVAARAGSSGRTTVMVGDGINDAPALAAAHVGVAVGLSSATAVHAADVVLMRERLEDLSWFLEKSARTEAIVAQNIALSLALMGAAALPIVHASLPLWLAVLMHEGGTMLVGLNGLRLLR